MSVTDDSIRFAPPAEPSLAMGVIGNCAFSALIDVRGRIVWCCLPRFDSAPVFNALLEPQPGQADATTPGSGDSQASAFAIEIEDFAELTRLVLAVADEYAGGRVVSLLEGGYNTSALAGSVEAHLRELFDAKPV